jgi:hypothetical protein
MVRVAQKNQARALTRQTATPATPAMTLAMASARQLAIEGSNVDLIRRMLMPQAHHTDAVHAG